MKVFVPKRHLLHSPEKEYKNGIYRSYRESPDRIEKIIHTLRHNEKFSIVECEGSEDLIKNNVHENRMIQLFKDINFKNYIIPDTFNIKRKSKEPIENEFMLGSYLFDTATPFGPETYNVLENLLYTIKQSIKYLRRNKKNAYLAIRPPGHHAGYDFFGGNCYINNAAIASSLLKKYGKVAILDIDYHHGNGTQDIFYYTNTLYISIHADPAYEFPYFWGYEDEAGEGEGYGFNYNIHLQKNSAKKEYLFELKNALEIISSYSPTFLVLSLGLNIYKDDPTGSFDINRDGLNEIGILINILNIPTLIVQEGGYNINDIGKNAEAILEPFNE
jgi:acetoin utilization deacetylase AcuC-like enzyme